MTTSPKEGHTKNLLGMGIVSDAGYLKPWAEKIGQFILNFGGIEFVTHKYLLLLEADEKAFESSIGVLLQPRVDRILMLLGTASHLPQVGRELAIRDWGEIKKMCLWRNHIAHNPVLPYWGWDKNPARDPPEGITMPDLRELRSGGGVHLDFETLSQLVEVSANLSRRLVETANSFPKKIPD
jgi:hypothetical protein